MQFQLWKQALHAYLETFEHDSDTETSFMRDS